MNVQQVDTRLVAYFPDERKSDMAIIIFPGGSYTDLAAHEGEGYATVFSGWGIPSFVSQYRVWSNTFPAPLQDARDAVRHVRSHAEEYGIDPQKIVVIGSSAGGHLAALLSTYTAALEGETDTFSDFCPNAQVLCYPVICSPQYEGISHTASYRFLLGTMDPQACLPYDPSLLVNKQTPPAFIWHTAEDATVNVINSYTYATALKKFNIPTELHIFPYGWHGLGIRDSYPHVMQWVSLFKNWLEYIKFLEKTV